MGINKTKLAVLRRQVDKLTAAVPGKGQGAGWMVVWRHYDLIQIVRDLAPSGCRYPYDWATLLVITKEAERIGQQDDPQLVSALEEFGRALDLANDPPNGGWLAECKLLEASLNETATKASGRLMQLLGVPEGPLGLPPAPYTEEGRPPRLTKLPESWLSPEGRAELSAIRSGAVAELAADAL